MLIEQVIKFQLRGPAPPGRTWAGGFAPRTPIATGGWGWTPRPPFVIRFSSLGYSTRLLSWTRYSTRRLSSLGYSTRLLSWTFALSKY